MKRAMTRKSNDGKDGFKPRGPRDPRRARAGFAGGRPSPKGPKGKPFRPARPPGAPAAPAAPKEADRIAKVIARAGLTSRREHAGQLRCLIRRRRAVAAKQNLHRALQFVPGD